MGRRRFLRRTAGGLAVALWPCVAGARVTAPYDWAAMPPRTSRRTFVDWMVAHRGETPGMLEKRYDAYGFIAGRHDIRDARDARAFLMTPREDFVLPETRDQAYALHYLDIGYGVTITPPQTVAHMTSALDVQFGHKVLEIGTGSGYQSAYLANLTDKVWTIEIIQPLYQRTGVIYADLIGQGYSEYAAISRKNGDGYYGWPDHAPFDRIIVTCGIDHIPPPLLQQLVPEGIMVIPVGPPGAQHILKVVKKRASDGRFVVARSDINNGLVVPFVPFTRLVNGSVRGTHNG